ncbi:MAG TPA: FAD-dependent oxidoreductase [Hyphomonadaceae bacterium]|jgi:glycine oxidase|nr:FAD-dependent oxidoreductase [Hyphomonadaceae bacterium]
MASAPKGRSLRIAVIGGGVVGMACALELKARGADVSVYERGTEIGAGVTARSAGMLGAAFEWGLEQDQLALAALARHAGEIWPDFAAKIERLGGGPVQMSKNGALAVARSEAEAEWLEALAAACQARGLAVRTLTGAALKTIEPGVTGAVRSALHLSGDQHVDPQVLLQRMAAALSRAGIALKYGRSIDRMVIGREITMPDGERVDSVVLATGAGLPPKFHGMRGEALDTGLVPVVPVKGQMLALASVPAAPSHVVHTRDVYIAPKAKWTLVGASIERGAEDFTVDRAVIAGLKEKAVAICGALKDAPEVSAWAGVRPGTADDAPMIGESAIPGVFAALGCYRNGVLFAPAVAEQVADAVLDGVRRSTFTPLRFNKDI